MKILILIVVAVIAVVLLAAWLVPIWAESWIEQNAGGAAAGYLGVGVSIDDVGLSLWKGRLELAGIVVENPEGFSDRDFLKIGSVTTQLALTSLLSRQIRIDNLVVDTIQLNIERGSQGFNYQAIVDRLRSRADQSSSTSGGGNRGPGFQIDSIDIHNVTATAQLRPSSPTREMTIRDVHLEDISSEDGAGALLQVLDKLLDSILSEGNFDALLGTARDLLNSFLGRD